MFLSLTDLIIENILFKRSSLLTYVKTGNHPRSCLDFLPKRPINSEWTNFKSDPGLLWSQQSMRMISSPCQSKSKFMFHTGFRLFFIIVVFCCVFSRVFYREVLNMKSGTKTAQLSVASRDHALIIFKMLGNLLWNSSFLPVRGGPHLITQYGSDWTMLEKEISLSESRMKTERENICIPFAGHANWFQPLVRNSSRNSKSFKNYVIIIFLLRQWSRGKIVATESIMVVPHTDYIPYPSISVLQSAWVVHVQWWEIPSNRRSTNRVPDPRCSRMYNFSCQHQSRNITRKL